MKKTLSFITALAMTAASVGALAANAVYYDPDPGFTTPEEERRMNFVPLTFKEYLEMDDATFMEYVKGMELWDFSADKAAECGFGDDTVDDEEKFAAYTDKNHFRQFFTENRETACFSFSPHPYTDELDYTITAADLGFCDDWEIEVRDYPCIITSDHFIHDDGSDEYLINYGGDYHDYVLSLPVEVYRDFETYIRLEAAATYVPKAVSEKFSFHGLYSDFGTGGSGVPVVFGDANGDGEVSIADATAIMQAIGNPDEYGLNGYGKVCADCCDFGGGVTPNDALAVMEYNAGMIEKLPKVTE